MIRFESVSFRYPDADRPVLQDVHLDVPEGELCLVVGRTGSGKSTLLRAVNGLVPHFSGGVLSGRVVVAGRDTRTHAPRDLADVVGLVGQDPAGMFVTDVVEDELAYGMESLGLPADVMRRRVEEVLDLLGLADLRHRPLATLSGGQRQRVAIGAVLTTHPRVLVLDEPTSALDPPAAEEVLATLTRLVHDLGITVLLAEHRLERVIHYADQVVYLPGDGAPMESGTAAQIMATCPVAPPVVRLGRLAGWSPPPLSVRDARRLAGPLRDRLARLAPPDPGPAAAQPGEPLASVRDLVVAYGDVVALRGVSLDLRAGEIVALMGRNGAGKSTLLAALVGLARPRAGRVTVGGTDPAALRPRQLIRRAGLVPQEPADLLYADSVAAECAQTDRDAQMPPGTCQRLLARLAPDIPLETHPRDLSEGQRLALALAIVLATRPPLVLLDEPTRGLDYPAKDRLVRVLRDLAAQGHGVLLATHDVELAAEVADRTVVLADGEVVADGPTARVVVGSLGFAPQVTKILAPLPWLTVSQVAAALSAAEVP
ncbi:cobalt ABC transporter ATP-binding protein [Carbonactinospora thermoautotrophica]|uniref:Cobalt ABC transporter ATP-binding protein n=2 Tax=Carbonactinospora thermoautotrophica TaxID=1469144 RepID=A0A132MR29_9ACTN|nr:ABC transporter ATP-binding protein [Carbonactinospora thermoautotrophica]KWX00244.1 cobalt ABC transporter ATP-binding protein [Carbonactinospora thermoautotrophica]